MELLNNISNYSVTRDKNNFLSFRYVFRPESSILSDSQNRFPPKPCGNDDFSAFKQGMRVVTNINRKNSILEAIKGVGKFSKIG